MPISVANQNPVRLSLDVSKAFRLTNDGTQTIYLGRNGALSPTNYDSKLLAGMSVNWDQQDNEVWLCTDVGVTSTFSWMYGAGSTFSPNTTITGNVNLAPGSTVAISGTVNVGGSVAISGNVSLAPGTTVAVAGTVNVAGSVAISGGTVSLSGPVSISGGVSVTGSTINVGNAVALANKPVLLRSIPFTFTAAAGNVLTLIPATDVSQYASVIIGYSLSPSVPVGVPIAANYTSIGAIITDINGFGGQSFAGQWLLDGCAFNGAFIQVPVKNVQLAGNMQIFKGATSYTGTGTLYIYGSSEAVTTPVYVNGTNTTVGDMPQGGMYNAQLSAIGTVQQWVASTNKDTQLYVYRDLSTTQVVAEISVANNGATYPILTQVFIGGTGANFVSINLSSLAPMRPLTVRLTEAVANGSALVNVLQKS